LTVKWKTWYTNQVVKTRRFKYWSLKTTQCKNESQQKRVSATTQFFNLRV
jgi:hypothetical protein